jgi:TolA-binding protein
MKHNKLFVFNLLFLILLLSACSGKKETQRNIAVWELTEKKAAQPTNDSILEPLLMAYVSYIQDYPEDEMSPIYLYRLGSIYVRMEKWDVATKHFEFLIKIYPESEPFQHALALAAKAYDERLNEKEKAGELYKIYLKEFPNGAAKKDAEFFFKPENEKAQSRIADDLKELYSDAQHKGPNRQVAHLLVRRYLNYVKQYPQSEFAPIYCFEGGKLASTIGESADAVELWMTIYEQYHDFHLYPETMLFLAFEYENKMPLYVQNSNKKEKFKAQNHARFKELKLHEIDWTKEAKKMYDSFLEKYPNHELAPQVKASLAHLGKTPNQVVTEFKVKLDSLRHTNTEIKK